MVRQHPVDVRTRNSTVSPSPVTDRHPTPLIHCHPDALPSLPVPELFADYVPGASHFHAIFRSALRAARRAATAARPASVSVAVVLAGTLKTLP